MFVWLVGCGSSDAGPATSAPLPMSAAGTAVLSAGSTAVQPSSAGMRAVTAPATAAVGGSGLAIHSAGSGVSGAASTAGQGGGLAAGSGAGAQASAGNSAAGNGAAGSGAAGSGAAGVAGSAGAAGGGATGSDDGIAFKPAFQPTGMPIMAADKTWTWVPFTDAKCRSGAPAGISVNFNRTSKQLMIYLEGGGACFDSQTCGANPDSVGSQTPAGGGVFDRNNAANPVKDWNYVYVPYCTGDVHMGAKDDGQVPGVTGTQHFMGRPNLKAFLNRIVPTFSDAEHVLLTGVSAGGFGASSNAVFVQWAFGSTPVTLIDDSGPTLSNKYLPTCLTNAYVTTWGLADSILEDCGSSCSASADYSTQFFDYSLKHSQGRASGLIESDQDSVIRGFFGIGTDNGADDCMGVLLLTPMSADDFLAGLLEYRSHAQPSGSFSTFYPSSTQHTWLGDNSFYSAMAGNVKLVDWFQNVLDNKPPIQAGH